MTSGIYIRTKPIWNKGLCKENDKRIKVRSIETIQKIKKSINNLYNSGYISPNKGRKFSDITKQRISEGNKGKYYSIEVKEKLSKMRIGIKLSDYHKQRISEGKRGIKLSEEHKMHISLGLKGKKYNCNRTLEKNSNWQGGKSFEPYSLVWNKKIRQKIKERDKRCMLCNTNLEILRELNRCVHIHHINYDKKNSFPQNLITLCIKCHMITNFNRNRWKTFFQDLLKEEYKYEYTQDQKILLNFLN